MGQIKDTADELAGKAKEAFGDVTDNENLQAEGIAQKKAAQARQAGEHVKNAAQDLKRTITD